MFPPSPRVIARPTHFCTFGLLFNRNYKVGDHTWLVFLLLLGLKRLLLVSKHVLDTMLVNSMEFAKSSQLRAKFLHLNLQIMKPTIGTLLAFHSRDAVETFLGHLLNPVNVKRNLFA